MKTLVISLLISSAWLATTSCQREKATDFASNLNFASSLPAPQIVSWPFDPTDNSPFETKGLKQTWTEFVISQPYRLAQPSDRTLSLSAHKRVSSNSPGQIIPYLVW